MHVERMNSFLSFQPGEEPPEGTFFMAMQAPSAQANAGVAIGDKRRWILSLPVSGTLMIDDGAARAIADHKNLIPAGILRVEGKFIRNEAVRFVHRGVEVARALVNMSADEITKVRGKQSTEFE